MNDAGLIELANKMLATPLMRPKVEALLRAAEREYHYGHIEKACKETARDTIAAENVAKFVQTSRAHGQFVIEVIELGQYYVFDIPSYKTMLERAELNKHSGSQEVTIEQIYSTIGPQKLVFLYSTKHDELGDILKKYYPDGYTMVSRDGGDHEFITSTIYSDYSKVYIEYHAVCDYIGQLSAEWRYLYLNNMLHAVGGPVARAFLCQDPGHFSETLVAQSETLPKSASETTWLDTISNKIGKKIGRRCVVTNLYVDGRFGKYIFLYNRPEEHCEFLARNGCEIIKISHAEWVNTSSSDTLLQTYCKEIVNRLTA